MVKPVSEVTPIERLRGRLVLPAKTNLLQLAERNFNRLRADQIAVKERIGAMMIEARKPYAVVDKELLASLQAEADSLSEPLAAARAERDRRRREQSERVRQTQGGAVADYVAAINDRLDELEEIVDIGAFINVEALADGIELHAVLGRMTAMLDGIHHLRRVLRGPGGGNS
ncbi:hypothetical protein EN850_20820 [Mesorhizobium sp. M8A.F.Ca.ET.207.01.1.1]|uniref:hypothetical protein n=1 Tax=Mesorhizobium sp. M8A.F.Ca.ET.207.01.1.1 TaxID=2563968 RepID=UPI00109D7FF2|nr:hypothetical protein [Mesorhizobium sp. M8A.F.Ca.ET.207.01.1.1]TGQ79334.1 hypothetical protein EN850_20820 [Mesorhizobium sp. M8A.F.Ca.ET.207.01.1.1]